MPRFSHLRTTILGLLIAGALFVVGSPQTGRMLQGSLLNTLEAEGFGVVEIGSFGRMRIIHPLRSSFRTRQLAAQSVLIGVSDTGERLLINTMSHKTGNSPPLKDEVDLTTLDGTLGSEDSTLYSRNVGVLCRNVSRHAVYRICRSVDSARWSRSLRPSHTKRVWRHPYSGSNDGE